MDEEAEALDWVEATEDVLARGVASGTGATGAGWKESLTSSMTLARCRVQSGVSVMEVEVLSMNRTVMSWVVKAKVISSMIYESQVSVMVRSGTGQDGASASGTHSTDPR